MTRCLYLLRHGDSLDKKTGEVDIDRRLSPGGVIQVCAIASYLKEKKLRVDQIVTSTATRTLETTSLLNKVLQLSAGDILSREEIYEASANDLVTVITNLDDRQQHVMIVGHNPGLSWLTGYLSGASPIPMSTATLVRVDFDKVSWHEITEGRGKVSIITDPETMKRST